MPNLTAHCTTTNLCLYFTGEELQTRVPHLNPTRDQYVSVCLHIRHDCMSSGSKSSYLTSPVCLSVQQEEGEMNTTPKVSACSTPGEGQRARRAPEGNRWRQQLTWIQVSIEADELLSAGSNTNLLYLTEVNHLISFLWELQENYWTTKLHIW